MKRRTLLHSCLLLALTGCGGADKNSGYQLPDSFHAARSRWLQQGITSYRYTIQKLALAPNSAVQATVRGGVVTEAVYTSSGVALSAQEMAALPTLTGLFDLAEQEAGKSVSSIEFHSNDSYGYLEWLVIDYDRQMSDEELIYMVSDFVPQMTGVGARYQLPVEYFAAKQRWGQSGITSYQVTILPYLLIGPGPIRITVAQGRIASAVFLRTGTALTTEDFNSWRVPTLDGMFDMTEAVAVRGIDDGRFEYDAQYGFLTYMKLDYYLSMYDDETIYMASDFVPQASPSAG